MTRPIEEIKKNWGLVPEPPPVCPKCEYDEPDKIHHEATFAIPECTFWMCPECDEQWGHE